MANAAQPFDAELLACALALASTETPTPTELDRALAELFPNGTGPTAADVVAGGWLVPAISDRKRLRRPPLAPAEQAARLLETATPAAPDRREPAAPTGPLFSYFRGPITNTKPYRAITPAELLTVLTSDYARPTTETIRATADKPTRERLKKRLDYVTASGIFSHRNSSELVKHSGLLVLDFDHLPDPAAAREILLADKVLANKVVLLFTSPSGDGLKVFVRTSPNAGHNDNFKAYADYLGRLYPNLGLRADEKAKDVARACFVPYAPDAWLAPAYTLAAQ